MVLADAEQAGLADRLLECLGMRLLVRVEQRRTAYRHPAHPDVTVSVDAVAGVGTFMETEVMSADAIAAADVVERVEKELDVLDCPTVDLPYRDLAMTR